MSWVYFAYIHQEPYSGGLRFYVYRADRFEKKSQRLDESGWVDHEIGAPNLDGMPIAEEQAKRLLSGMREAGVKLPDEMQSNGHRGALEFHLADMRKLVAKCMRIEL